MKLVLAALVALASSNVAAQTTSSESVERYYCTQFGPFFIRFDTEKAAGVFAILPNNDLGSMVGALEGLKLEGEWFELDSRGEIRLTFSDDWSRFDAEYAVSNDPDSWTGGWTGVLQPEGDPATFEQNGVRFQCR